MVLACMCELYAAYPQELEIKSTVRLEYLKKVGVQGGGVLQGLIKAL